MHIYPHSTILACALNVKFRSLSALKCIKHNYRNLQPPKLAGGGYAKSSKIATPHAAILRQRRPFFLTKSSLPSTSNYLCRHFGVSFLNVVRHPPPSPSVTGIHRRYLTLLNYILITTDSPTHPVSQSRPDHYATMLLVDS